MKMAIISLRSLYFLSLLVILTAQPDFRYYRCFNNGNYTANSAYHSNLKSLLSSLTSNTQIDYGFYNSSYGQNSDKVNSIALCRGDLKPDECRGCLNNITILLPRLCPNQKQAIGGYDECMMHYSNQSIFRVMEPDFSIRLWNPDNATEWDAFSAVLRDLLARLRSKAAAGDSHLKFAADNATAGFQTIYAVVQCTPDLSEQECSDCLTAGFSEIPDCCDRKRGGRVVKTTCNFRYESYRFYDPSADDSPRDPPRGKSNTSTTLIATVVPIVVFVVLIIFICIYLRQRKPKITIESESEASDEIEPAESLQFDFDTIRAATDNFSNENKLGQGGFGPVYKGRLFNGQEIAVKRLSMNSGQGDVEFKNEVLLVAKLQHRNLVRLLGFSLNRKERLLVYELVPNKSLDYFIFDPIKRAQLDWQRRYKIIGGIARGLLYLHEDSRLRIVHRDLKASNILLDEEMNSKISDFGMARLFIVDQTQDNTSRIVGTYGYMAPEYLKHGQFSLKSDVFSFGVLILEMVSGKKNSNIHNGENAEDLISFAWRSWKDGAASNLVDPTMNNVSRNEIMRCIHIGLLCVQENVADRPTMASVVLMLSSYSLTLPVPAEPEFFVHSRTTTSSGHNSGATRSSESRSRSFQASSNEDSITELYPR